MTSVALPGAAEALIKSNAQDKVFLTGLATPNAMRKYVRENVVKKFVLWNPVDLGYLSIQAAKAAIDGDVDENTTSITTGCLGQIQIINNEFLLGEPLIFDKENIDDYNF